MATESAELTDGTLEEFMAQAAETAKGGVFAVVVLGKVSSRNAWPAKDGRAASTSCKTVVGEGESWNLRFPDGSATPGLFQKGAFLVTNIYVGPKGVSADVMGFA